MRPRKFMSLCHFEFAYLYELICNAKSTQRFKEHCNVIGCLIGHLTHSLFNILNIYLFTWENNSLWRVSTRVCVCLQSCFCLKSMWRPCYWEEAKQIKVRGHIKVFTTLLGTWTSDLVESLFIINICITIFVDQQ